MYLMLCVYACLKDTINRTCGSAWEGGERCMGEGRDIPSAIECTELQQEGAMNANRWHLQISAAPLSPLLPLCLASGFASASSRIMMLLLSAPPLWGSSVAMVGPPWRRRRRRGREEEEASCSLLRAKGASLSDDTSCFPPMSLRNGSGYCLAIQREKQCVQSFSSNVKCQRTAQCINLQPRYPSTSFILFFKHPCSDDIQMQS